VGNSRLEAFSDGVFAVAITLLALNLAIGGPGHGALTGQLLSHWPAYVAYVVSFSTIGVIWVNHHALFSQIASADRRLLFLNLLLLFFVVSIPFTTSTMAEYLPANDSDAHVATATYGVIMTGMALSFDLVLWHSLRLNHVPAPPTRAGRFLIQLRFGVGTIVYVVATALAFVNVWIAVALFAATALYYVLQQSPKTPSAE
jgi:uncharacterized membrane protein